MDAFSDSDNEDDAAKEILRQIEIRKRKEETAVLRKIKADKKEAENARLYPKQIKKMEFKDYLEQQIPFNYEEKDIFKSFIPKIVEVFEKEPNFSEKVKQLKSESDLHNFIRKWYNNLGLGLNDTPEKQSTNDFFVKHWRIIIDALYDLGNITQKEGFKENIFAILQERAVHSMNLKMDADQVYEKLNRKKAQEEAVYEETLRLFDRFGINDLDEDIIREMKEINLKKLDSVGRDTSPVRIQCSRKLVKALTEKFANQFVEVEMTKSNSEEDEIDPEFDKLINIPIENRSNGVTEGSNDTINCIPASTTSRQRENVLGRDRNETRESNVRVYSMKNLDNAVFDFKNRRPPVNFEAATEENRKDQLYKIYEEKHKQRKVQFEVYGSSKNKMRLFMKPNGYISDDADDGPTTNYMDLTLSEGDHVLREIKKIHRLPLIVFPEYVISNTETRYSNRLKLPEFPCHVHLLQGYHGNLLGRFWFPNHIITFTPEQRENCRNHIISEQHSLRCSQGLLHDYSEEDLRAVYETQLQGLHQKMRRGLSRRRLPWSRKKKGQPSAQVCGVLLFTDWRLFFLTDFVCQNACIQMMPTNIGDDFFSSMTEYVVELIRDPTIDFHTIIFAFGGTPSFTTAAFSRFWKQLVVQTTKSIDVVWTAQDWCDGLNSSQEDRYHLNEFNDYVRNVFEIMGSTGHRNYKWVNIREEYQIPEQNPNNIAYDSDGTPDIMKLQPLYWSYLDYFTRESDYYCHTGFFYGNKRTHPDYKANDSRYPRHWEVIVNDGEFCQ